MKKGEAERAIRYLVHQWAKERYGSSTLLPEIHPSFSEFTCWLSDQGHSHYLSFRSVVGPQYDAEMWFDQELKQTWRN